MVLSGQSLATLPAKVTEFAGSSVATRSYWPRPGAIASTSSRSSLLRRESAWCGAVAAILDVPVSDDLDRAFMAELHESGACLRLPAQHAGGERLEIRVGHATRELLFDHRHQLCGIDRLVRRFQHADDRTPVRALRKRRTIRG